MPSLQERINNIINDIEKKNLTIEKKTQWIRKKEESIKNSSNQNDIYSLRIQIEILQDDINRLKNEIRLNNSKLDELKAEQAIQEEKARSRNIKPILEFLAKYKEMVSNYYLKGINEYFEAKKIYHDKCKKLQDDFYNKHKMSYTKQEEIHRQYAREFGKVRGFTEYYPNPNYDSNNRWSKKELTRHVTGSAEYAKNFFKDDLQSSIDYLNRVLDKDCDAKYDRLVSDVVNYIGKITDASDLSVGEKGELNGIIIGEKGRVHVHTESAGGYNIQCFHYRTYINYIN